MSSVARRQAIQNSFKQAQRLALESYMMSLRQDQAKQTQCRAKSSSDQARALCDTASFDSAGTHVGESRGRSGICKSSARSQLYGYYAKIGVDNLILWGHIHRELANAVRDHILLSKMLEPIRCSTGSRDFASRVRGAVASVLAEEGFEESKFLRTVTVRFSAQHWIGCGLSIHSNGLDKALNAWHKLRVARGVALFMCGHATKAYTA